MNIVTELVWPHKEDAVHPIPIQLIVHDFAGLFPNLPRGLRAGIWYVGTEKAVNQEYIIGVIVARHLCPIMAPRADLKNKYGRVKVRIDGNVANVTAPIFDKDPVNDLFYEEYGPERIRAVEVPE